MKTHNRMGWGGGGGGEWGFEGKEEKKDVKEYLMTRYPVDGFRLVDI